ncbi:MAG TPA: zinc-ribbon domain-containing protein, partial [Methanoregulaceae archaeon]|nr:zinc-ribbon domain-containing protein [Methanoregulaceae archaeon]
MTIKFCPKCGTALSPGAKFCPGCGEQTTASAPGGQGLQKAAEAIQTVSSTISKVESATQSAKTVARTAKDLSTITIRPPAQWKVVVGEVLPVAGK